MNWQRPCSCTLSYIQANKYQPIFEEYHLPSAYKILSNIILQNLDPYVDKATADH